MKKVISFKKAVVIVLGVHLLGFVALFGYSKYNSYAAKKERDKKREFLLSSSNTSTFAKKTPPLKIVAIPKPIIVKEVEIVPVEAKTSIKNIDIKKMTREEKLIHIQYIKEELIRRGRVDIIKKYKNITL